MHRAAAHAAILVARPYLPGGLHKMKVPTTVATCASLVGFVFQLRSNTSRRLGRGTSACDTDSLDAAR